MSRFKRICTIFKELFLIHFNHYITVIDGTLLVFCHNHKIPVWDFIEHLPVCEVERLHERGNLS